MSDHSPLLALTFMLILGTAGCTTGPAPLPFKNDPLPAAQAEPDQTVSLDALGWVPAALSPNLGNQVKHTTSLPYTGDLDNPQVIIKDGRYHPYYTHVHMGGTVTWINEEKTTQSVTSPVPGGKTRMGDWGGTLAPGERYTMSFNKVTGTFTYFSTFNPKQHGNIIVVGDQR